MVTDAATGFYYFRMFNDEDTGDIATDYDYGHALPPTLVEIMDTVTDAIHDTTGRFEGKEASKSGKLRFEDEMAAGSGGEGQGEAEGDGEGEGEGEGEGGEVGGESEGVRSAEGIGDYWPSEAVGGESEGAYHDPTTSWYKPRLARIEDILGDLAVTLSVILNHMDPLLTSSFH